MELAVQTHFSQGWNTSLIAKIAALGATEIRDEQEWGKVETSVDNYVFTPTLTNYMAKVNAAGIGTMLTFTSGNALFDSGKTPYTQEGRDAYADYIVAALTKYGSQVEEIEVWNEFNGNYTGPGAADRATYYTALLKTVYDKVKPLFPDVKILGGSTQSVATGALESIFKLGALSYMDGVVVHPYRNTPEHVDDELTHLNEVMAKYGAVKPIYATEFGNSFKDAAEAPDFMVKMVTLMSSVHVAEASWYSAMDEAYYPNMGLFAADGTAKPAAASFAFIQKSLIPLGDPVKIATGNDSTLVYRFGADTYVMWSTGRDVTFNPDGTAYNSKGEVIAAPTTLGMAPIIYKGSGFTLADGDVVADSLMQFAESGWQYFAMAPNGNLVDLTNIDWNWTSYLGTKYTNPLAVNVDGLRPAGDGNSPVKVVERYMSDKTQTIAIDGSWKTGTGDGDDLHILVNGKEVFTKIVQGAFTLSDFRVTLKAGDTLDFVVGPNQIFDTGDAMIRHITLTRVDGTHVTPALIVGQPAFHDIAGTGGADTLTGTDGIDRIQGYAGDDMISGGAGDDLLDGGIGRNGIDGGEGDDMVSYAGAATGVTVRLGWGSAYQAINATTTDKLSNIEGVTGSAFADLFYGTAAQEHFSGGASDDRVIFSAGGDRIDGGEGKDSIEFSTWTRGVTLSLAATDIQQIDSDGTSVRIGSVEKILGTYFDDVLTAGSSSELQGGLGNDRLVGNAGNDILAGGPGINTVSYELAKGGVTVSIAIATAQDTKSAGSDILTGIQNLIGSGFGDELTGSTGNNIIDGGAGDDIVIGSAGADALTGGLGADRFGYRLAADSKPGAYDSILDFSAAQGDRIDLLAMDANSKLVGDQGFALVGSFGKHAGELMISAEAGGWFVQADIDGNGLADFGLHIQGAAPLKPADFIM